MKLIDTIESESTREPGSLPDRCQVDFEQPSNEDFVVLQLRNNAYYVPSSALLPIESTLKQVVCDNIVDLRQLHAPGSEDGWTAPGDSLPYLGAYRSLLASSQSLGAESHATNRFLTIY